MVTAQRIACFSLAMYFAALAHAQPRASAEPAPGEPPTVHNFELQPDQALSIDEAVIIALDRNPYLRVLRLDPEISATSIAAESAVFDARVGASALYRRSDNPLTSQITAAGTTATSQTQREFLAHPNQPSHLSYSKKLPSGATARLQYSLPAEAIDPVGDFRIVNPAWRSGISAIIEQPLLRDSGARIARAKMHVARNVYLSSKKEVQVAMNDLARTTRLKYWNLLFALQSANIQAKALSRTKAMLENETKRSEIGASHKANVAVALELLQRVRLAELDARQSVLGQERELRMEIGFDGFDGTRIVLTDRDVDRTSHILWNEALPMAMTSRPEIAAQRHRIVAARSDVQRFGNELQPDLSLFGRLSTVGLGTAPDTAVGNSLELNHGEAALGISYQRSVNQTKARAQLRRAQLTLAQEEARLKQIEYETHMALLRAHQNLDSKKERLELLEVRITAAHERLDSSRKQFQNLHALRIDFMLRASEALTNAEIEKAQGELAYRHAVEEWAYQCGGLFAQWSSLGQVPH